MPNEVDRSLSMGLDAYHTGLSVVSEADREIPDFSRQLETPLSVQYRAELLSYLLFLSETHGEVDERRAEFIRKVLDFQFTREEFTELMHRLNLHKQDFGSLIPTSLRAAVALDRKRQTHDASQTIIRILEKIGDAFRMYSQNADMLEEMDQRIYVLALTNWLASQGYTDTLSMASAIPDRLPENIPDAPLPLKADTSASESIARESVQFEKETRETRDPQTQEPPKENLEDLMNELNSLTGLKGVKEDVNSLVNLLKIKRLRKERNFSDIDVSMHLVFTGNPGTGKTTVARLLARIYHALGALSKVQLIEVDRSELVSGYVGQTAIKTQEVTNSAKGGVLFIDEAYALTSGKDKSDFGYEAVNTLLVEMENNRDDLAVIVAGYPEPMEEFLQSNPGLRSRFNKFIDFPDYTPEELYAIFESMTSKAGYSLPEQTQEKAKAIFTDMYENRDSDFANGRSVRNFFEKAMVRQANRLAAESEISDEMLAALLPEDLTDQEKNEQTDPEQNKTEKDKEDANDHEETTQITEEKDLFAKEFPEPAGKQQNPDSQKAPDSPDPVHEISKASAELDAILNQAKDALDQIPGLPESSETEDSGSEERGDSHEDHQDAES